MSKPVTDAGIVSVVEPIDQEKQGVKGNPEGAGQAASGVGSTTATIAQAAEGNEQDLQSVKGRAAVADDLLKAASGPQSESKVKEQEALRQFQNIIRAWYTDPKRAS